MNLHEDIKAFRTIIDNISNTTGLRSDVIEKDYYVTLMLKELASKQAKIPAYFKGGTALYKALKSIRRFSEDIDITLCTDSYSTNNQIKTNLEKVSKKFLSLQFGKNEVNTKGAITSIYHYDSLFDLDVNDSLQRFGNVKVEATSFTISEPYHDIAVSPVLYDYATVEFKDTLKTKYNVYPFAVKTITLPRIFVDKIFAAEFYYQRKEYFDVAKHVYDITVLLQNEDIRMFLKNNEELNRIVGLKREEEKDRIGSNLDDKSIKEFSYLDELEHDKEFASDFERMQKIYVLNKADILDIKKVYESIEMVKAKFC